MNIEIVLTDNTQQQIVSQLCELYTYEMTDLADFDINENGYFGYKGLSSFWKSENKYAYLIYVNKKLAGFALIQKGSPIDKMDTEIWDVVEFFIMRKYRRKGVGEFVAKNLWSSTNGSWQVRVWDNNISAHAFWDKTIRSYVGHMISPKRITYEGHECLLIYCFDSSN